MNKYFVQYGTRTLRTTNKFRFFINNKETPNTNPKVLFRFGLVYG